jgi:protein required for attachment to host cells
MRARRWILAADEQIGRLLRVERTATDHLHAVIVDEIQESWEEHQHGRPSPLRGKSGHSYASEGHEEETRRDRFAKEIAIWLEQQAERLHMERIAVFAPPRFLGSLREAWSARFALRLDEHHGDLTHLNTGDLVTHESIASLIATGNS